MMERIGARNELPQILCLAGEATLALDAPQQALAFANQALAIAREMDLALEEAMARRVLGQIALAGGDLQTARASLEASQAVLAQLDERYELGRVLLWQARLAYASRQPEHVLAALQRSAQIFTELDAQFDLDMVCAVAQDYGIAWGEIVSACET
jgi:tetratricopeptide (TPR) repeat protein